MALEGQTNTSIVSQELADRVFQLQQSIVRPNEALRQPQRDPVLRKILQEGVIPYFTVATILGNKVLLADPEGRFEEFTPNNEYNKDKMLRYYLVADDFKLGVASHGDVRYVRVSEVASMKITLPEIQENIRQELKDFCDRHQ